MEEDLDFQYFAKLLGPHQIKGPRGIFPAYPPLSGPVQYASKHFRWVNDFSTLCYYLISYIFMKPEIILSGSS